MYYTFDAPFVRILGLYSNVLEDPGVISDQNGTYSALDQRQITFLTTALKRAKSEKYPGALIIATHRPPFTGGSDHGASPLMLSDLDNACTAAGVWPHAVFSGHAHNYQRFTRIASGFQIPYMAAGCGGHSPLSAMRSTIRTPYKIDDTITLESYDDKDYGYLHVRECNNHADRVPSSVGWRHNEDPRRRCHRQPVHLPSQLMHQKCAARRVSPQYEPRFSNPPKILGFDSA